MKNISQYFSESYAPYKVIVINKQVMPLEKENRQSSIFVEHYDLDLQNRPINPRALSPREMCKLADLFHASAQAGGEYLKSHGVIPGSVLQVNPSAPGTVIWYTPPGQVNLLFADQLGIPCGKAHVPAMIWKADREALQVFAFKGSQRPQASTRLYHAPFFNVFRSGAVCMGSVCLEASGCACLEDFILLWQQYFWNSYFSHLVEDFCPVRGNIVQLWQDQIATGSPFPQDQLIASPCSTLKTILT